MAGTMRKMAVYLGLVEDDQYDDDLMYGSEDRGPDRNSSRERYSDRDTVRVSESEDDFTRRRVSSQGPSRDWRSDDTQTMEPVGSHPAGSRSKRASKSPDYKITTLHPRSYNDARRIGEEFRSGNPVIMNLTELDDVDAKRIVDFAAGLVFGLRGSIERVTNKVFMLSPANVEVGVEAARAQLENSRN